MKNLKKIKSKPLKNVAVQITYVEGTHAEG